MKVSASGVAAALDRVNAEIRTAADNAGWGPVRLIAVTKTVPPERVLEAYEAGQRLFGENRVHEGVAKIEALHTRAPDAEWHLVGTLQSNKARAAVGSFGMIQSVDRIDLARRLSRLAGEAGSTLPVLAECNLSGEATKAGFSAEELRRAFAELVDLPHLSWRGLMTIAPLAEDPEDVRPVFRRLRELRDGLRAAHGPVQFAELSMGMSGDFRVAIQEGATMVRIGQAIFGQRPVP